MRMLRFGCGGSSDEIFQREHSGDFSRHHCTDLPSRGHQRNQANGPGLPSAAFPAAEGHAGEEKMPSLIPAKPLNCLSDRYCK
jgi:hypothetical protein